MSALANDQQPSEPAVTTHMDLASYIGDTARVGFCCENAKAGVAGENSVLAQSFEITSWSFEVSQRPWAPALTVRLPSTSVAFCLCMLLCVKGVCARDRRSFLFFGGRRFASRPDAAHPPDKVWA